LNRRGKDSGANLEPASPPSRKEEVGPGENVSGNQYTKDELEEGDQLLEDESVSGGSEGGNGRDGGNAILGNFGPLLLTPITVIGVVSVGVSISTAMACFLEGCVTP